jgi:hypothetical protein
MALLPPPDISVAYVSKDSGVPSREFYNWIRSIYEIVRGAAPVGAASALASPTGRSGSRAFVTDATATTFASIVTGGGSNYVPVYCDGVNLRIG